MYLHVEVPQVIFMRYGADTGHSAMAFSSVVSMLRQYSYGSAINLSVSFMILFGSAAIAGSCRLRKRKLNAHTTVQRALKEKLSSQKTEEALCNRNGSNGTDKVFTQAEGCRTAGVMSLCSKVTISAVECFPVTVDITQEEEESMKHESGR